MKLNPAKIPGWLLSILLVFMVIWTQTDDVGWGLTAALLYCVVIAELYSALEELTKELKDKG